MRLVIVSTNLFKNLNKLSYNISLDEDSIYILSNFDEVSSIIEKKNESDYILAVYNTDLIKALSIKDKKLKGVFLNTCCDEMFSVNEVNEILTFQKKRGFVKLVSFENYHLFINEINKKIKKFNEILV